MGNEDADLLYQVGGMNYEYALDRATLMNYFIGMDIKSMLTCDLQSCLHNVNVCLWF